MTIDSVLRAIGVATCLYTVALFVSLMSTAALNVASFNAGTLCSDGSCTTVAAMQNHHATPRQDLSPSTVHMAALFFTGTLE
jgi:hypothetical protein